MKPWTTDIQAIPNMDGFPNGRRLEDDVTRIELQAVGGLVLAAIGLPFDDFVSGGSLVTPQLLNELNYSTGIERNDTAFSEFFPYVQLPWSGVRTSCGCGQAKGGGSPQKSISQNDAALGTGIAAPDFIVSAYPNPFAGSSTIKYRVTKPSSVTISVYDALGKQVKVLVNQKQNSGTYNVQWNAGNSPRGIYFINAIIDGNLKQSVKVTKQ